MTDTNPTLYIVATPIGNMEDITLRALRILKEVDLIFAEDTRKAGILLKYHNIQTKTDSYHQNSKDSKLQKIISIIREGKTIALITDAGTPGLSDPGLDLIRKLYANKTLIKKINIVPIPGPSALTATISICPINLTSFQFLGFIPTKKGRQTFFENIKNAVRPSIFYESKHRLEKTLQSLSNTLEETTKILIARELTKLYEEIIYDTPANILKHLSENPLSKKGEFVIVIPTTIKHK